MTDNDRLKSAMFMMVRNQMEGLKGALNALGDAIPELGTMLHGLYQEADSLANRLGRVHGAFLGEAHRKDGNP